MKNRLTLLLFIVLQLLISSVSYGKPKVVIPKETKTAQVARYRQECFANLDEKLSCLPLGEILAQAGKTGAAKKSFGEGCKHALAARKEGCRGKGGSHIKNCSVHAMYNCIELANIWVAEGSLDKANKMYQKVCDTGIIEGCQKLQGNPDSPILFWGSIILIGLACLIIAAMIFQDESQFKASEQLDDKASKGKPAKNYGIVLKYSQPFFKRYLTPAISSMKGKKKIKEKYKHRLAVAGLTEDLSSEDFFAFKLFLIIGFPIVFLFLRTFLEEDWPLSYVPIVAVVGYFYPNIWVRGLIDQRKKNILIALPFSIDMLALSVEAGLDFVAAMGKVVEKSKPNPLRDEFELMLRELKIGSSRAEALRNMAWRIDLIQMASFSATLIAADSVGASIGPILKSLAGEIRQKKSSDAEKAGATAATKILFPMLFLIVPAVFIVVAAPMVIGALNSK
jgi:tight adherence protein C